MLSRSPPPRKRLNWRDGKAAHEGLERGAPSAFGIRAGAGVAQLGRGKALAQRDELPRRFGDRAAAEAVARGKAFHARMKRRKRRARRAAELFPELGGGERTLEADREQDWML